MTADLALRFERISSRGAHNDLRLSIGTHRHVCDSYYFAIDQSPTAAGAGLGTKMGRLLEQWNEQVAELVGSGGIAYLPYDFSDQCTAWLRVSSPDGQTALVQAGWSRIEAWGIEPSDYADTPEVTDFAPIDGAGIECSLLDLTACIEANRAASVATGP
ncbi:hypothetical protein ABZ128_18265 [Streptomyces sp. NPDC006326]|uniref:hypothetical protein n=1 Tax=Streptomyces sp. NPDC006326 TaxID=3156752 RepID=UPI0033BB6946